MACFAKATVRLSPPLTRPIKLFNKLPSARTHPRLSRTPQLHGPIPTVTLYFLHKREKIFLI